MAGMAFTRGAEEIDVKVRDYNTAQVHFQGTAKPDGVKFHADNFSDYLITIS